MPKASLFPDVIDHYPSIAALKLSHPQNRVIAVVSGYYAAGDGGGGAYYFDATSTGTDDGGSIIAPTVGSTTGRWIGIFPDKKYNSKRFGAKGDGTTDDTTRLNAWLAAGKDLFLDAGSHRITSAIFRETADSDICFDAHPQAKIVMDVNFPHANTHQAAVAFKNITNLSIKNLRVIGQGLSTSPITWKNNITNVQLVGLNVELCTNVTIDDYYADEVIKAGIRCYTNTLVAINRPYVKKTYGFGIDARDCDDLRISKGKFTGIGMLLYPDGDLGLAALGILVTKGHRIHIEDCYIDNFANSNKCEGSEHVWWIGNHIKNSGKDAIKTQPFGTVYSDYCHVIGNTVEANTDAQPDGSAMIQVNDVKHFEIIGNHLKGTPRPTGIENAIYVYSTNDSLFKVEHGIIANNDIDTVGTNGIDIGNLANVTIIGNRIKDFAQIQSAHGIFMHNCQFITITNNVIFNTTFNSSAANHHGIFVQQTSDFILTSNTFRNIRGLGINAGVLASKTIVIAQNNFVKCGAQAINIFGEGGSSRAVTFLKMEGNIIDEPNMNTSNAGIGFGSNMDIIMASVARSMINKGTGLCAFGWATISTGTISKLDIGGVITVGGITDPLLLTTPGLMTEGENRFRGTGSPEGVVTAKKSAQYMRTDGGAGTCFYVKESDTTNTGWVAK